MKTFILSCIALVTAQVLNAQVKVEYLGLRSANLTCIDINFGIIAVGSDRNGVYWRQPGFASDTGWTKIPLDSTVQAVYPHKSGPIGWAIGAGIQPREGNPPFIFCSYQATEFFPNSDGIEPATTTAVTDMDGYPDLTVCGETYAVTDRILYRQNFADTVWNPVFTGTIEGSLSVVKVHEDSPGVVLTGGADGFAAHLLVKSLDFGDNWEDISPGATIEDVDFAGPEADTIFAACGARVFRSVNGGADWDPVYEDQSDHLTEILCLPGTSTVYAAGGTFPAEQAVLVASYDLGITWEDIPVDSLGTILGLEDGRDGWVYFVTRDEGAYRFRESTSGVEDVSRSSEIILEQNIPNPAHDNTLITYALAHPSHITLTISDPSGRLVEELVNAYVPAGDHEIQWDAGHVYSGVYFLTLTSEGARITRRIVVK